MNFLKLIIFSLALIAINNYAMAENAIQEKGLSLIPDTAMSVVILNNKKDDIGLNAIIETMKSRFSLAKSEERQKIVEDLSTMLNVNEIIGAFFYTSSLKPLYALVISVNDKQIVDYYCKKINALFNNPDEVWFKEISGYKVIYNPERFQQSENKDFSCYVVLDNYIVVSDDFELLAKIIENYLKQSSSILDSSTFQQMPNVTIEEADGFIYVTNLNKELTNSLNGWKGEIGFVPFANSDLIKSIWFSFDIIDKDSARGRIVFVPFQKEFKDAIANDANFLMEAMKRKFIAENLVYEKEVVISEDNVVMNFNIKGLAGLWDKLLIEESGDSESMEVVSALVTRTASKSKINFAGIVAFFALFSFLVQLGIQKRKKNISK